MSLICPVAVPGKGRNFLNQKIFLHVLTWWVVAYIGIVAIMVVVEMKSGGMWFENRELKFIPPIVSFLGLISVPVGSTIALIINRYIRWSVCNYVHVISILLWLSIVALVLWVHDSGFYYW